MPESIPPLSFNRAPVTAYGEVQWLNPRIRRIVARNPGAYGFTGTNTYIIGLERVVIIDPGPALDEHFEALIRAVAGEHVTAIAITHRHRDHCALAPQLAEYLQSPIAAHAYVRDVSASTGPMAESSFDAQLQTDITLNDGAVLDCSSPLRVLHTPGHTPDHICFDLEQDVILFSGDHVMGWSTSVIAPPLGHMRDYLTSLERLMQYNHTLYLPGHGAEITNPQRFVSALIGHRKLRGQKIAELLATGQYTTLEHLTRTLYGTIDEHLFPAAMATTQAHIDMLAPGFEW